jgi:hypothetical protein
VVFHFKALFVRLREGFSALGATVTLKSIVVLSMFWASIRQLWQVTVKSPVEFHSQKPDTTFADSYGFGCAFRFPGGGSSLHRGANLEAGKGFEPQNGVRGTVCRFTVDRIRPLYQPAKGKS